MPAGGKKNKAPKAKSSESAGSTAKSSEPGPPPGLDKPSPTSGGWAQQLKEASPEEQALEAEKQKKRDAAAQASAAETAKKNSQKEWYEQERAKTERKKTQEDRKWEQKLAKDKQKAMEEGILEAQEGIDGLWYVEVAPKTWRECSGQYFCTWCEKHLNDLTLTSHLESEGHRKKRGYMAPQSSNGSNGYSTASPSQTALPTHPPAKSPQPTAQATSCWSCDASQLEDWQELADGYIRCKPCGKVCDGGHELSQSHIDKLEWWRYRQQIEKNGYEAPELEYLAYVPFDELTDPNGPRGLRCLLCKKWCNDDWSHTGSNASPDGSKEHQKNLRNYGPGNQWWEEEVAKVRLKWHPRVCKQVTSTSRQKQAATVAPWAHVTEAARQKTKGSKAEELPDGWSSHVDPEGNTYYFHEGSGTSTWDMPKPGQPTQAPTQEDTLPEGWRMVRDDSGAPYYYNEVTNETQWEPPESESLWKDAEDEQGNVYYYNTKTGETTWDKPAGF